MTRERIYLAGLVTLVGAGLMVYAQTWAFAWDEGFHLLAAQLILKGMRPYLDFFHAQTPLYAYWNAFWMRIFGDTWRTAHAVSAVCTTIALWLVGDYVLDRFQGGAWRKNWRVPLMLTAVLITGLNSQVVQFATIGQGYAICLVAIFAAYRCAVANARTDGFWPAFGAGFFASVAAASSLLTAPMGPVVFVWMMLPPGARVKRAAAYIAGGFVPFLPLLRLFLMSPKVVLFGAVKFHLLYRTVDWSESEKQNVDVALGWLESPHAMLMGLLLLLALVFLARTAIPMSFRRELRLCMALCIAESLYLLYVRPTFSRYYLFVVPFAAILCCVGLYYAGTHIGRPDKPRWVVLIAAALMCLGIGRTLNGGKGDYRWSDWQKLADKVNEVTRKDGIIDADEAVYFITRRTPPSGMEYEDTHKLRLAKHLADTLHVFSKEELARRVNAGVFDTVSTCEDEDKTDKAVDLGSLYKQKVDVGDCTVYWDLAKKPQ